MFNIIVCCDKNNGISKNGIIPWNNIDDLEYFKSKTINQVVIMGRKTWNSLPKSFIKTGIGLLDRINIVLSKSNKFIYKPQYIYNDFDDALEYAYSFGKQVYIIGGEQLYDQVIYHKDLGYIYMTKLNDDYQCDKYFKYDKFLDLKNLEIPIININNGSIYTLFMKNIKEEKYQLLLKDILLNGNKVEDRTKTGILTLNSKQLQFDIRNTIPLCTLKKTPFTWIVKELLWILSGSTNVKTLYDQGVSIWNANTTREFLDDNGLNYFQQFDMGESYGFLMRHFGAEYKTCKTNYINKGTDQLINVINELKNNPHSRRHIISLWNPATINNMALPPCLKEYQFFVNNNYLDCMATLRSSDTFLALLWNCTTVSLLTYIIGHLTGYKPGKITINIGDAHIYNTHISQVKELLTRIPRPFPHMILKPFKNINELTVDHFQIQNYYPYPTIKAKMAV